MKKLSKLELHILKIHIQLDHSVQLIAKELYAPEWLVHNVIFKYLNGAVKNGYYIDKSIKQPIVLPKKSLTPTPASVQIGLQQLREAGLISED